jgi:cytochrome P450
VLPQWKLTLHDTVFVVTHKYVSNCILMQTGYGHASLFWKGFPRRADPRKIMHKTFRFRKLRTLGTKLARCT